MPICWLAGKGLNKVRYIYIRCAQHTHTQPSRVTYNGPYG